MTHPFIEFGKNLTRRQFFGRATGSLAAGLGTSALGSILGAGTPDLRTEPTGGVLGQPHHQPRARRVIYLHMMGGPSHVDLFDYKPELRAAAGQDLRSMPSI